MSICLFFDCTKIFQWIGNLGVGVFSSSFVVIFLEKINDKNNKKFLDTLRENYFFSLKRDLIYILKTELECTSKYLLLDEELETVKVKVNIFEAFNCLIENFSKVEEFYSHRREHINRDFLDKSKKEIDLLCEIPLDVYNMVYKDFLYIEEHLHDFFSTGVINESQYNLLRGMKDLTDNVIRYLESGKNGHFNKVIFKEKKYLFNAYKNIFELFNIDDDIDYEIAIKKMH